jgi:hypothetical protein
MTRAYRVPVGGGGVETTDRLRARVARGRPNWWVILAVSLALMALLVATAGAPADRAPPRRSLGESSTGDAHVVSPRVRTNPGPAPTPHASTPTTTTTTTSPRATATASGTALVSAHGFGDDTGAAADGPTGVTTTTAPPPPPATTTTTTTTQPASLPADRMETQGVLDPPVQTSNGYGFTGAGATEVSVVWSGDTYLTMTVSCPDGSQSVGGTSAMEASLPDAQGSCQATVSEPASESTSLTYTITIGPAGG